MDYALPSTGEFFQTVIDASNPETLSYCLIQHPSLATSFLPNGQPPLARAIVNKNFAVVKTLLKTGADVLQRQNNRTILHIACELSEWSDNTRSTLYLIIEAILGKVCVSDKKGFINAMVNGQTALYTASSKCSKDIILLLLRHGADAEVTSSRQYTCLHAMCIAAVNASPSGRFVLPKNLSLEKKMECILAVVPKVRTVINIATISGSNTALHKFAQSLESEDRVMDQQISSFLRFMANNGSSLHAYNHDRETVENVISRLSPGLKASILTLQVLGAERNRQDMTASASPKLRYTDMREFLARILSSREFSVIPIELTRILDILEPRMHTLEEAKAMSRNELIGFIPHTPRYAIDSLLLPIIKDAICQNGFIKMESSIYSHMNPVNVDSTTYKPRRSSFVSPPLPVSNENYVTQRSEEATNESYDRTPDVGYVVPRPTENADAGIFRYVVSRPTENVDAGIYMVPKHN